MKTPIVSLYASPCGHLSITFVFSSINAAIFPFNKLIHRLGVSLICIYDNSWNPQVEFFLTADFYYGVTHRVIISTRGHWINSKNKNIWYFDFIKI